MRNVGVLLGVLAGAVGLALPAHAQYPGTTSTTAVTPAVSVASQSAGSIGVGQTTTVASCGLQQGSATVAVNGRMATPDTVDADGCARATIAVLGVTLVRVNGAEFAADCGPGANTLSVSGTGTGGAPRVVNTVFGIPCPADATGGLLPRTGALVLRWSLLGAALIAVGALVVLAERGRPAAQSG